MHQQQELNLPDAEVYFFPQFLSKEESDLYFVMLMKEVNWQQESIKMFGRQLSMPRLTAWYGDKSYTYSGLQNKPQPWLPVLLELKKRVEVVSGQKYNSVLLNLYRSGQDSMGWHADDEAELGQEPSIASLSFGAERKFSFKHKSRKDLKGQSITLHHGSLLLMQGQTQHHWLHHVPKTTRTVEPRINLTFRMVVE
ncbi:alpha-ketoglutarate-dependent dioxygenase AlkB family protein [Pontibacter cellulosilyticus]|uniref:Alpha-ketoglutarate-dependent dioxygenase AlkB n=1 Tax=Pontibacter cellulosilyticus TaxID=1720253 RepID=A0A923NAR9_9BACT|nr:alpha-ketoglutarate-dependent dioxygenase AlkB [Pontibacter cellulosilyticus]MBC5994962.1 alpha-ketoglutarate-dependent dioxygenase AlkB [Pontibacter cellulosilyticus]